MSLTPFERMQLVSEVYRIGDEANGPLLENKEVEISKISRNKEKIERRKLKDRKKEIKKRQKELCKLNEKMKRQQNYNKCKRYVLEQEMEDRRYFEEFKVPRKLDEKEREFTNYDLEWTKDEDDFKKLEEQIFKRSRSKSKRGSPQKMKVKIIEVTDRLTKVKEQEKVFTSPKTIKNEQIPPKKKSKKKQIRSKKSKITVQELDGVSLNTEKNTERSRSKTPKPKKSIKIVASINRDTKRDRSSSNSTTKKVKKIPKKKNPIPVKKSPVTKSRTSFTRPQTPQPSSPSKKHRQTNSKKVPSSSSKKTNKKSEKKNRQVIESKLPSITVNNPETPQKIEDDNTTKKQKSEAHDKFVRKVKMIITRNRFFKLSAPDGQQANIKSLSDVVVERKSATFSPFSNKSCFDKPDDVLDEISIEPNLPLPSYISEANSNLQATCEDLSDIKSQLGL